jgi:signal transduction histidine kinase
MVILDIAIVNVALSSIQVDLGISRENLQWVVSAYALVFGGLLLLAGRGRPARAPADLSRGRRVTAKRLVLVSVVLFGTTGTAQALGPDGSAVATFSLAEPLTAATLGLVGLGERPAPLAAVGALLVLGGLLVHAAQRRPQAPAPQAIRKSRPVPAGNYSDVAFGPAESIQGTRKTSAVAAPITVARIIEAADAERRRLERNLHDGAQQRLVGLALALRAIETQLLTDPEAAGRQLASAREELALALDELRDLARGLHPAILTNRGLGPALKALAARAPVAVRVLALPQRRLPEPVEAAAYYLVAEAVTNVTRHARASVATVSVTQTGDRARIEVRDDGAGGADIGHGSGMRGLADRLQALGGHLELDSPPGEGTTLIGTIPLRRSAG